MELYESTFKQPISTFWQRLMCLKLFILGLQKQKHAPFTMKNAIWLLGHEILQFCLVFWNWVLTLYFFILFWSLFLNFFKKKNCLRGKHLWWQLAPLHFLIGCLRRSGELVWFHHCPSFLFSRHTLSVQQKPNISHQKRDTWGSWAQL